MFDRRSPRRATIPHSQLALLGDAELCGRSSADRAVGPG